MALMLGLVGLCTLLSAAGHGAWAQQVAEQRDERVWYGHGLFGKGDAGPQHRWAGGIDRGGAIKCRIGDRGGNCSSPANCIFKLSAREEHMREHFCMHERMERPYLGVSSSASGPSPPRVIAPSLSPCWLVLLSQASLLVLICGFKRAWCIAASAAGACCCCTGLTACMPMGGGRQMARHQGAGRIHMQLL